MCVYICMCLGLYVCIYTHTHVCVAIVSVLPALSALDTIQLPRQIPRQYEDTHTVVRAHIYSRMEQYAARQYEDRHTVVRAHIYSRMRTHVVRGHTQYGKRMI
jgi:hypothetical protein